MRIKLKQAFDLQMGKTPARNNMEFWGGTHKWISIADLGNAGKYIDSTKESISDEGVEASGIKIVPKGTVVMSFKLSIGKTAITSEDMYTNEAIIAFDNNGTYEIAADYLYHFCCGTNWGAGTNKAVMGLTLNKATLSEYEIEIPDISEQREIAKKLDGVDTLIEKHRAQLVALDKLVKSRFIELFGNEKHRMMMSEVCSIITDGTHQPPKFKREGIPFIFVSNIAEDRLTYNAEKFIDQETYDELIKRTPIEIGDVLLSTVGSYGHPAVVKSDKNFLFQRHIAYLKPRREIVDSEFLHGAILSSGVQAQIEKAVKGIAQKTLNLSEIKKMVIPVPTMDMQKHFAAFVAEVDKSKHRSEYCRCKLIKLLQRLSSTEEE